MTNKEWVNCKQCDRPKHKLRPCVCEDETYDIQDDEEDIQQDKE